jgi:hypothetical protein
MSSRGKKKTTMAKLNREAKLRERRYEKQARKDARRDAAAHPELHEVESHDEEQDSDSLVSEAETPVRTGA